MADLTTSAAVKAVLGIPSGVTQHDTLISTLIEVADQEVLSFCNVTTLTQQTLTEVFDVDNRDTDQIMLSNFPIQSVTAVSSSGDALTTDEYYADLTTGKVKLKTVGQYFNEGRQKVSVTYVAGYSAVPADIKHAATLIAVAHFNANRLAGLSSQQAGAYKVTRGSSGLPAEALRILGRYSRIFPRG